MSVSLLNDFNIDLLANILSYIDVSDIRNCWIVNKKFALIMSTKLHFWKRQSDYALIRKNKQFIGYYHLFDPFFIKGESLKSQMGWIFDLRKIVISLVKHNDDHRLLINKQHNNHKWVQFCILYKPSTLYEVNVYNSESHVIRTGVMETFHPDGRRIATTEFLNKEVIKAYGYVPSESAYWNGEVYKKKYQYIPHGKGTWTFDDGRISEGAIHGKPL